MKKRILSLILCLAMVATTLMLPISAAVDLTADTFSWSDKSSLQLDAPAHNSHATFISLGTISQTSTISFWAMMDPASSDCASRFWFDVTVDSANATTNMLGRLATADNGVNPSYYTNGDNTKKVATTAGTWFRVDMIVNFEKQNFTAYVNNTALATVAFDKTYSSYGYIRIPYVRNTGTTTYQMAYIDNLMVTKGANVPNADDLFATLSPNTLKAAKSNVLFFDPYDSATIGGVKATAGNVGNPAQGGVPSGKATPFSNEIVKTQGVAAARTITIEENSSLTILTPNANGQYRVPFGSISENTTLTWFVKASDTYAELTDSFYYKLYSGDTFLGGFESNPFSANGMTLHMNTTQANQGSGYSGANIANINKAVWNRLDLTVDFTNKQISGYVNYKLVETLSFSDSGLTSFDHLKIGAYRNSYQGGNRIFIDNLVLSKGATAPAKGDFCSNLTERAYRENADNIILCNTFNSDAAIVHGTTATSFEAGKIYSWRADGNAGFCSISNTEGFTLPENGKPVYRGVQSSRVDNHGDQKFSIRFVATIDDIENMTMLGFDITYNGKTQRVVCENVYSKLTGSSTSGVTVEYTAEDFGAGYIFALTLTGLSTKTEIYDFKVTPFIYDMSYVKTEGDTARIVYTNGLLTENSFDVDAPVKADVGTALNIDSDALYNIYNNYIIKAGRNIQDIGYWAKDWFAYHYKNAGLSDIFYNPEWTVPSSLGLYQDAIDKYQYEPTKLKLEASYRIYTETNVDPYKVWMEECIKNGINPWLSFRMNDVHYANDKAATTDPNVKAQDQFFFTAKANGWMIGNSRSSYWSSNDCTIGSRTWYQYAYNYQIAEIRQHFLNNIEDQLNSYGAYIYGIELDWQRQIWCFPNDSTSNIQYMNMMLEAVNKIVEKYEAKYGHDIKVAIRLNRDIDEAKYFGFDVLNFAQQGWIDVVIPSSYWGSTDNDMPIAEWVSRLSGTGVEVWAGLECHVMYEPFWQTVGSLAGYTRQYLGQGADKMYLYNLFAYQGKMTSRVCASLDMANAAERRSYVVTESNCTPYNVGFTQYDPLPISLSKTGSASVTINHGKLLEDNQVVIFIGLSGTTAPAVKYNGVTCQYIGTSTSTTGHSSLGNSAASYLGTVVAYSVPASAVANATSGTITMTANNAAITIKYIELMN